MEMTGRGGFLRRMPGRDTPYMVVALAKLPFDVFRGLPDGRRRVDRVQFTGACRDRVLCVALFAAPLRLCVESGEQPRRRKPAYEVASVSALVARVEDRLPGS